MGVPSGRRTVYITERQARESKIPPGEYIIRRFKDEHDIEITDINDSRMQYEVITGGQASRVTFHPNGYREYGPSERWEGK